MRRTGLGTALDRGDAGVRIATSRHGTELSVSRLSRLVDRTGRDGMTVAFGAPGRGLPEILGVDPPDGEDEAAPDDAPAGFDVWLDSIPNQGSETVRTEEAMFATLACLTLTE